MRERPGANNRVTGALPSLAEEDVQHSGHWAGWLLLLPLLGVAYGVWVYGLLDGVRPDYMHLLWMGVALMAAVAAMAWWFGRRTHSGAGPIPSALVVLVLAGFVYYAGAAAALAAMLLALVAVAVGGLFDKRVQVSAWSRLLVGLAVIAAVVGWLLPFPVHDPRIYLVAMGGIVLLRRRAVAEQLQSCLSHWSAIACAHPAWLGLAVMAAAVASMGLWLPSLNYDDNAGHLILPNQLLADGYYRLDVSSQLAAVQPWANNVLHGVTALVAGQVSPSALNLLWLLLGVTGAYRLARSIGGPRAAALACAAIYASHPLTTHFASTMQVDGPVAAVLLHLAADLAAGKGRLASPWTTGVMLGLLAGLKISNVVYVFLPILWWTWRALRDRELKSLMVLVAAAAVVGGSSYTYATLVTGNPLFPFFNAVFKSPFLPPINLHDIRWDTGVQWRAIWDITFNTTRFSEAAPGAAGITLLVALPGVVAEIVRRRDSRWICLWMLASGALMFWQIQYLRYLFPAIAVLATVGVVGLSRYTDRRVFTALVLIVVTINTLLMPTTSWMARDNPWGKLVREGVSAKAGIVSSVIPERALLDRLYMRLPEACVLMTDSHSPFAGSFKGRANAIKWHDPRLYVTAAWAQKDPTGKRWQRVLLAVGASHLVLAHQADTPLSTALAGLGFERVDSEGSAELWASSSVEKRRCSGRFFHQRDEADRLFRWGTQ